MKAFKWTLASLCLAGAAALAYAPSLNFQVQPGVYDPADTDLVQASWLDGTGCPTNAGTSSNGANKPNGTYTDPACPTGDSKDKQNQGLLLVKTGPTANYAAALANINGLPKNTVLTELGYDIRKSTSTTDSRGSHCGSGAPRFDITTVDGNSYFLGCNSPAPTTQTAGNGWLRLRWGTGAAGSVMAYNASTNVLEPITAAVQSIQIVFDEGQDIGPDNFGAAILDNIDINGTLVGQGGGGPSN